MKAVYVICWLAVATLLTACGSIQYTVDDGRHVDEAMLANIRTLAGGEQTIRPAIVRSATLKTTACETQWELPFAVASNDGLGMDERIAWVRALKVDERLTVIASTPESELDMWDKIVSINGYQSNSGEKMNQVLMERRDDGKPFQVTTAEGRTVSVTPFLVCRGHTTIASSSKPAAQDYHWSYSTHPLEVFREPLTEDEALWVVLWTQGLSEEGGFRMKAYQYARIFVAVAAVATGIGALSRSSQVAGAAAGEEAHAAVAAQSAGATMANAVGIQIAKSVVASQAASIAQQQAANAMAASSKNRASLEGVAWAAGTAFAKADTWSFGRILELGADPMAAITLHQKLIIAGSAANAFVLDTERLALLQTTAKAVQLDTRMASILSGQEPEVGVEEKKETGQLTGSKISRAGIP